MLAKNEVIDHYHIEEKPKYIIVKFTALESDVISSQLVIIIHTPHVLIIQDHRLGTSDGNT